MHCLCLFPNMTKIEVKHFWGLTSVIQGISLFDLTQTVLIHNCEALFFALVQICTLVLGASL